MQEKILDNEDKVENGVRRRFLENGGHFWRMKKTYLKIYLLKRTVLCSYSVTTEVCI